MSYTIVPLGNPGKEYETTRHNAARIMLSLMKHDVEGLNDCEVFMPRSYMNESGKDVATYLRYHEGREIILMYDDKDLALGTIRISYDRGDGGHNGVKSIIESLGTKAFTRLRIGIAGNDQDGNLSVPQGEAVQKFVMGHFTDEEMKILKQTAPSALAALKDIVSLGTGKAMEKNN